MWKAADLVIEDYNGFQFDPFDEEHFCEKLLLLMNSTERFKELGENGRKIIDQWAPDIIVNELIQSFQKVSAYG
jgi:hypothetical protein